MAKTDAGATAGWHPDIHNALDTLDRLSAATYAFFVSPDFSEANLGNSAAADRRHFNTIQAAVNAAQRTDSYLNRNIIFVYPGQYSENITINGSVNIVGLMRPLHEILAGGYGAKIAGQTAAQSPIITVQPTDGAVCRVWLSNLTFENAYNLDSGGHIDAAYAIDFQAPTTYGSFQNGLGISGCQFRMQTWGDNNTWEHGIKMRGWNRFTMRDSDISAFTYSGGLYNGGIKRVIDSRGGGTSASIANNRIDNCAFDCGYAGEGTAALFNGGSQSSNQVTVTSWKIPTTNYALTWHDSIGDNTFNGTNTSDMAAYNNMAGVNRVSL